MSKKMQQNLIVLGISFAAIVFIYFSYMLSPLQKKYNEQQKKLTTIESKLDEMKRRALELPKLKMEMGMLQQEVEDLGKMIPKEKDIPKLLKIISKISQKYQLKVTSIDPMPVASQPNYNEVPFRIALSGTYHSLAMFLADIGQESRILNVKNITYTGLPAEADKKAKTTISVNFILVAYTFKG